jgi:hypothetical protein
MSWVLHGHRERPEVTNRLGTFGFESQDYDRVRFAESMTNQVDVGFDDGDHMFVHGFNLQLYDLWVCSFRFFVSFLPFIFPEMDSAPTKRARVSEEAAAGAASYTVEDEDEVPNVMLNIFKSATIREIQMANMKSATTPSEVFMRKELNFSIVLRAASMVSKLFEMVAAVLNRGGGRESKGTIGFTIVMLNGIPHMAVDVWDESKTTVVSVRVVTDVFIHPDFTGCEGSRDAPQFPVFRVTCKSMVDKLSHAKDFHRVLIFQHKNRSDLLEILIDTPDKVGNVQHETISIQSDSWESLRLDDVTHKYTLQIVIKNITQLCKMQRDGSNSGTLTISIYEAKGAAAGLRDAGGAGSGAGSGAEAATRYRQNFILKLEVCNSLKETSSTLRPITTEVERVGDVTTMHFVESDHMSSLDIMEMVEHSEVKFKQSFVSGYIEAFLSKFDPNKLVTIRLASESPMVMSYSHGSLVMCQMVAAPFFDADE